MSAAEQLFDDFWIWRLEESPELASFCGNHDYDHLLDDVSEDGYKRRAQAATEFLSRCTNILGRQDINTEDRKNVGLLAEDLRIYLTGLEFKGYLFPVSYAEGIHVDFELFTSWMDFNTEEDFNKYCCRLKALPKRIQHVEELLRIGVAQGLTLHQQSMVGVKEQFDGIEKAPEDTVFFEPFKSAPASLNLESVKREAMVCIEGEVQPAFKRLKDYVLLEYSQYLRPREGVFCLPGGSALYQECLRWHLSVDMTPEQVHQKGLEEVSRIKQEMLKVIEKTGFKGSFQDFVLHLRSHDDFFLKDKESVLKRYHDLQEVIRPKLKDFFYSSPKSAMVIEASPESRPNAPIAYYLAGTLDGSRPGKFFVNATNPKMCPKYEMVTLSLHEGEPGHHLQAMYTIEMKGVPLFRQYIEDMNYYAAPSRFPLHTAYGEGWGMYCEYLGEEMRLYEDPYDMFGHLSFEMYRACRLVVDTGLHAFGWSFEQAKKLLVENTALSETLIENEVRRYITWPGQACAYKVGELKIKELRKFATDKLGDKFDVRDFHEVVLRVGVVPLNILQEAVEAYVREKGAQFTSS